MDIVCIKKHLIIKLKNTMGGKITENNGIYKSTKNRNEKGLQRGLGLTQVDRVVKDYNGYVSRNHSDNYFETKIMLPII